MSRPDFPTIVKAIHPVIETLEQRSLRSAGAHLDGNELIVTGTAGNDAIFISLAA